MSVTRQSLGGSTGVNFYLVGIQSSEDTERIQKAWLGARSEIQRWKWLALGNSEQYFLENLGTICINVPTANSGGLVLLEVTLRNNLGQVVYTYVPMSPSSITWYRPKGGDALRLGR